MKSDKLTALANGWVADPRRGVAAVRRLSAADRAVVVDIVAKQLRSDPAARETWRRAVATAERKASKAKRR